MDFETRTLEGLSRIGFSDKEARVYIALLAIGKGDVTDISKRSGLKRSIVYVVLDHLLQKGAASAVPGTKVKRYAASDPEVVLHQSESTVASLRRSLEYYAALEKSSGSGTIVKYYDTQTGIEAVYDEQNQSKEMKIITSGHHLSAVMPNVWNAWKNQIQAGVINVKDWQYLLNASDKGGEVAESLCAGGAQVRFLAEKGESLFDFVLWNKSISITSLEHKPNMTVIESKKIHDSFAYFFDLLFANATI